MRRDRSALLVLDPDQFVALAGHEVDRQHVADARNVVFVFTRVRLEPRELQCWQSVFADCRSDRACLLHAAFLPASARLSQLPTAIQKSFCALKSQALAAACVVCSQAPALLSALTFS